MAKKRALNSESETTPIAALLEESTAELREHLRIVVRRREELAAGSFDPDLVGAVTALHRGIVAAAAEERLRMKKLADENIPPPAVLDALRRMPVDDRDFILRTLTAESTESVLS